MESKSPAELSEFHGLGDFPVPSRIENIFKNTGGAKDETQSDVAPKNFSGKNPSPTHPANGFSPVR